MRKLKPERFNNLPKATNWYLCEDTSVQVFYSFNWRDHYPEMLSRNQHRFFSWVCRFFLRGLRKTTTTWSKSTLNYEFTFCVNVVKGWVDFAKRVLIRFQSEEASDCSPGRVLSHGAGQTEPSAEPPGEPAPAAPAVSPRPLGTERAQCSEAHRWEFKWGQDHWEKCWKVKPGQQTAPFCLAAALEPGPEKNDYKLAVVWVYSASCSHFQMFGPWEDPKPHFATQLCGVFGVCKKMFIHVA